MARFKKKKEGGVPAINTSSLPDIIFMLLFFFMVTTVMKETTLFVRTKVPEASVAKKLEKKSLVSYINIGIPLPEKVKQLGTEPRIQLNDQIANVNDVQQFVHTERQAVLESNRPYMTFSLKVDRETKMGIVTDVKQELRQAGAFKINYSSRKGLKRKE